jgi:GGDEF domain-containing protein
MGIAIYPADAQDIDALIKAADAAMYNAKQVGNSFRFYELPRSP